MKKFFLGLAALMLTACNENRQPEAMTSVDSASVVTDLMMSRRSIRAYKDSVISRDTLNEILKCGIHAPNGHSPCPGFHGMADMLKSPPCGSVLSGR